jgi:uncharacterized surface protein with fasciclin (FAS1) repeats
MPKPDLQQRRAFGLAAVTFTFTLAAALAGCASAPAPATITDTAARTPQLSTLTRLLNEAGLADTLRGAGPYTVFAPTDEAFKAVPQKTLDELAANKDMLRAVLTYHVIEGKVTAAEVKTGPAKTVQGASVALSKAGTFLTVEDAVVQTADVPATNGVVHLIDRVLMPPRR